MRYYRPLKTRDQLFLDLEDERNQMHIAGCFVFDAKPLEVESGGVDFELIRAYVESRLTRLPHYRQRLSKTPLERRPAWIDDEDFNLDYHVRHTHLPLPGDERQLKRLVGRIISERLDLHKPLWELWVVEGLEHDRFALIVKVHHCMTDGLGGVQLLQRLLQAEPERSFETPPKWIPREPPSVASMAIEDVTRRLAQPFNLMRRGIEAARDPSASLAALRDTLTGFGEVAMLDLLPASDTLLNHRRGPHRRFDWWQCDLERIERIRSSLGGTVNDVVVSTVTGAIARFLAARGVVQSELEATVFRVACPVAPPGARRSREGGTGNRISMLAIPVPLAERDPAKRYERVRRALHEAKASQQTRALDTISEIGDWTSPSLAAALARREARRHASNLVVTNVPGPAASLYMLDAALLASYPVVPLMPEQALAIALFSYADVLYWGFNSDWDLMPDLHELVGYTEAALDELERAAGVHASAPSGAGKTARKTARKTTGRPEPTASTDRA